MVNMTTNNKFDVNNIRKLLFNENAFVKNLISILPIPTSALAAQDNESSKFGGKINGQPEKSRAQSLTELQDRFKNMRPKKNMNYKEKLTNKSLKKKLKKKSRIEERKLNQKAVRMQKISEIETKHDPNASAEKFTKTTKPVFNREGKMVFSKFDFSGLGQNSDKKSERDPKKILKNLEKQKAKIAELQEKGDNEKAAELKQKHAWKTALAKSEGEKIKDDPLLLKKTIKKKDQQRKGSENKWKARTEGVQKAQDAKQHKRTENLDKRKKDKKVKLMKRASKRGRIVPGF